jgi:hypothetical protein
MVVFARRAATHSTGGDAITTTGSAPKVPVLQQQKEGIDDDDDDEPSHKTKSTRMLRGRFTKGVRLLLLLLLSASLCFSWYSADLNSLPDGAAANFIFRFHESHKEVEGNTNSIITPKSVANIKTTLSAQEEEEQLRLEARAKYQNCTVSFVPPPPRKSPSEWRKPLWVTSYPASGSASPTKKGDLTKQLIDAITGLKAGTKNYHMSIKGGKLRRCYGMSETAACTQGHPTVPVGPESQTANFQSAVIFSIRNFATAFPAGFTDKNMAYHGGTGQPPEEQWRKVRDQYMESSLQESWIQQIQWWRKNANAVNYYRIALYLPFEWLLSPIKGPPLVQELANLYQQQAGYDVVAPPVDIPCIWYQMAHKEWKRQDQLLQNQNQQHPSYTPGYTPEQRDFIEQEFDKLIGELEESTYKSSNKKNNKSDQFLLELLRDYKAEIRSRIPLDRPSTKNRTSS